MATGGDVDRIHYMSPGALLPRSPGPLRHEHPLIRLQVHFGFQPLVLYDTWCYDAWAIYERVLGPTLFDLVVDYLLE